MTHTEGKTALKNGRVAFRSATEKDAFGVAHHSHTNLRRILRTEKRIKVLMLALGHLEQHHVIANAELVRKRLRQLCSRDNTAITIRFVDHGQDFSEWDLDKDGFVIDSRPCQATQWCGNCVMNFGKLRAGGKVVIFTHTDGKLTMNYRIQSLTPGPAAGQVKYPEHKPKASLMHEP
jgi:hypothetical protein